MDTVISEAAGFNPAPPSVMHIDLNSCFATVEQQANPLLRGKPLAVAAYTSPGGCILAASVEAKRFGVKTGMRVSEGRALVPELIVMPSDPWKYRFVNRKLLSLLREYSADVSVKSIDEMVLHLAQAPKLNSEIRNPNFRSSSESKIQVSGAHGHEAVVRAMLSIGREIKERIKSEIGEWLTVSVGIAPNRYLAKTASGLHKPDGLDVITAANAGSVFAGMELEDLCGIKEGFGSRLRNYGIGTAAAFYRAPIKLLKAAFASIIGYHWWLRLHGWEADDREFDRKSFGQSHALYRPFTPSQRQLKQVLCQLVEKMGRRMRAHGYAAGGIHVGALFADHTFWHQGHRLAQPLFANTDLYHAAAGTLARSPDRPVRILSVASFGLADAQVSQLELFADDGRKRAVTRAVDAVCDRWGDFTVTSGRMLSMQRRVLDRIAFGGVKELEESIFRDSVEHEPA
ncbi:hypothetical protein A2Z33_05230 [Candidatus Gottesmanbacteria bacterium RBG_16_52_11]|uniref:UmuC domain-containing protein n=1 Tax=Candidatus Gottesmanbacteria bacterium RBG_16_52_11 TaxID=1798374 RepID=A0A1F5YRB1_9BACT|nr:MAG: hypothetical protein A2Z33_05230 [Candidatus Gottesmanbacteria bacterium RBG_16_52_11]